MAGKRINLADLADTPTVPEARVPTFAEPSPRTARVQQVARNPLNTREISADRGRIAEIADSLRTHGQLQPCTVVTRAAFLRLFPEHEASIGEAIFVQVTGGRRRAAALVAEIPTLDIVVKNGLADSRAAFVSATAAENIDREDYDPIEEARAVQLLVTECESGKAAAERLSRTPGWVSQRLNLLKLVPELQELVRSGELPLREARDLHQVPADQQLEEWRRRQREREFTAVNRADASEANPVEESQKPAEQITEGAAPPRPRRSWVAGAIKRLGGTPEKIASSLRAELSDEEVRALAACLLDEAVPSATSSSATTA